MYSYSKKRRSAEDSKRIILHCLAMGIGWKGQERIKIFRKEAFQDLLEEIPQEAILFGHKACAEWDILIKEDIPNPEKISAKHILFLLSCTDEGGKMLVIISLGQEIAFVIRPKGNSY